MEKVKYPLKIYISSVTKAFKISIITLLFMCLVTGKDSQFKLHGDNLIPWITLSSFPLSIIYFFFYFLKKHKEKYTRTNQ